MTHLAQPNESRESVFKKIGRRSREALTNSRVAHALENRATSVALQGLFRVMNLRLLVDPRYRRLMYHKQNGRPADDWRATVLLTARDGSFSLEATFGKGRVSCRRGRHGTPDATLSFRNAEAARALLTKSPARVLDMLLTSDLVFYGNLSHVARLSFMLNSLVNRNKRPDVPYRRPVSLPEPRRSLPMKPCDGVQHLDDPGLADFSLDDVPRVAGFLNDCFAITPEICPERPQLYTDYLRNHDFELTSLEGESHPALRQAGAFKHLMSHRKPMIREGDLLAGTTTSKPKGVVVYPECGGITIWPELGTVSRRKLNPYRISRETADILNSDVFPFWIDRNVREFARARFNNPKSIQLDERFVFYFQWKTQAVSHTIPSFERVLNRGLEALKTDALNRIVDASASKKSNGASHRLSTFYEAVAVSLEGVLDYASNLSNEAKREAKKQTDPVRKAELEQISRICAKVPAQPAETLHEALQSMWTTWIACHMENTNAGLSVGRLDQLLQPFFDAEMKRIPEEDGEARRAYIQKTIELVGCFFLRCTDHLPQSADLGNKLFGGSASGQVITLGGVTRDGKNAVNDMTFILLKVTEMLGLRDPNMNARYHEGINSEAYLGRLCEVNYNTHATPSIHNDGDVIDVLRDQGFALKDARDWSATGCVEPTSCGRHYGHTNCMMFNLVAPLEMALNDGFHPVAGEQIGLRTGDPTAFQSFEAFFQAYLEQLRYMIELATEANNLFGEAHQLVRPTPLLSSLIADAVENGKDLSEGGARYNSSGIGNVGLVDVVDSLMTIKQLVFDERRIDISLLLDALKEDFDGHDVLLSRILNRVPKFGSGHPQPRKIADRLVAFCHETFRAQPHYRGGRYNSGFWSMSNHVAFGLLSGALPSGRRKGKAFTPGVTPSPIRHASLLDHIHDVAALDHHLMPNNIAFNVKVVPGPNDTQRQAVDTMRGYVSAYMKEGGMQMQFNVVSTETLRDAMAHPEKYPTLMVRISGYNAYFVDLNDDMKRELIERAEHRLSG